MICDKTVFTRSIEEDGETGCRQGRKEMDMNTHMEKIQRILLVGFYALTALTTGVWYITGIFSIRTPLLETLLFLLLAVLTAGILFFFANRLKDRLSQKTFIGMTVLCFAALILLQLAAAYVLEQGPAWDPGGVFISAKECVEQSAIITHTNYFSRFPNNTGLLFIEVLYFFLLRAVGIPITMFAASLLNVLFIDLAILFLFLFVRKVWGNRVAMLYLLMSLFFMPNVLYVPVVYTDTMSMVFVTLALYLFACYLKGRESGARLRTQILQLLAISFVLTAGTKVKGSVVILFVAFIVYLMCTVSFKKWIPALLVLLLPFFLLSAGFDAGMRSVNVIREDERQFRFPTEYWIYMGLKTPGGFNYDDFETIYALPDLQTKTEAARQGIADRLEEYGLSGLLNHIQEKAKYTYGDGTYFAGVKLNKAPVKDTRWHALFTTDGAYYTHYQSASNGYHILILLLLLVGIVKGFFGRKFDMETLLYILLFGLSIFLMIWETRSRYLVNFTPVMLALAAKNANDLVSAVAGFRRRQGGLYSVYSRITGKAGADSEKA